MEEQPSIGGAMAWIVPIVIAWILADKDRAYIASRDYWIGINLGIAGANMVRFIFECIRARKS